MSEIIKTDNHATNSDEYKNILHELRSIIDKGKHQAYKAIDNIRVQTYWQIGERIVREEVRHKDRAGYGKNLIGNLALDLRVKKSLLYETVAFYNCYQNFHTVCGELSWSHYGLLIQIEDTKERLFYQNRSIMHSWSVRELDSQIKKQYYQNTDNKEIENTFKTTLPTAIDIQKVFKPDYDLHFIQITENAKEKELEDKIIHNIEAFLKEFGEDFLFLGRQVPIRIDGEMHAIDLVLYHRAIPCIVLVDLKMGKIDSRDIGQMNKYVGYFRKNRQYEHEKDAIGLVICEETGKEEIIYALDGLEEKIFVAIYKTRLPDKACIKRAIDIL
jgi:predicted nuclease of restriction endonuclease-like (RecB) superfamily